MKLKSEKGFTGIDITIALIVLLLFISLISVILFNITKSSKGVERESEAAYIATNIIEAFKAKKYDDVLTTSGESWENIINYKDSRGNQIIPVKTEGEENFDDDKIYIAPGYTVKVKINKYIPEGDVEDLVKTVTVKVEYKLAAEIKNVEISANIVKYGKEM